MVRENRLRQRLEAGDVAFGAAAATHSPELVEVYGQLGLDFVWLDFEHSGGSPEDAPSLAHYSRTAEAADVDLLVRLPSNDPELVRKTLDAGIRTILIPRVETAAEARQAVEAARFVYEGEPGERGLAGVRAAGYGHEMEGYTEREDENVLVGVQVESKEAVENLDEILSVPDLGFVQIGHGDMSVSMGRPQDTDHPEVQGAIETTLDACLDAGVPIGRVPSDVEDAQQALDDGYQLLRIGDELEGVRQLVGDRLDSLR